MTQAAIYCVKGSAITSAQILIDFGRIVATPTAFLMPISFKSFLTSVAFVCWKLKLFKSEPNLFLIFNTLGWFWCDLIILSMTSEIRDPSVVPILLGIFLQLFSTMLIYCLLNICEMSYSSVMTFFPSTKVMSLLALIPLFVIKGLIKFQKLLLVSIPFSEKAGIF